MVEASWDCFTTSQQVVEDISFSIRKDQKCLQMLGGRWIALAKLLENQLILLKLGVSSGGQAIGEICPHTGENIVRTLHKMLS